MNVTIIAERYRPEPPNDVETWRLHEERALLLRSLAKSLDLDIRSWKDTDQNGWPREVAEIVIALGSAGVFTAMVAAFRIWIERNKMKDVTIKSPSGGTISLKNATAQDATEIAKTLGLNF